MFLLRENFSSVLLPDKFRCYTTSLITVVYPYLHYHSLPHRGWVSSFGEKIALAYQRFLQELLVFQSKQIPFHLILNNFFFFSRSFSYLSNLLVINFTDLERSASDCSPLICVCLFWSTKLRTV